MAEDLEQGINSVVQQACVSHGLTILLSKFHRYVTDVSIQATIQNELGSKDLTNFHAAQLNIHYLFTKIDQVKYISCSSPVDLVDVSKKYLGPVLHKDLT